MLAVRKIIGAYRRYKLKSYIWQLITAFRWVTLIKPAKTILFQRRSSYARSRKVNPLAGSSPSSCSIRHPASGHAPEMACRHDSLQNPSTPSCQSHSEDRCIRGVPQQEGQLGIPENVERRLSLAGCLCSILLHHLFDFSKTNWIRQPSSPPTTTAFKPSDRAIHSEKCYFPRTSKSSTNSTRALCEFLWSPTDSSRSWR